MYVYVSINIGLLGVLVAEFRVLGLSFSGLRDGGLIQLTKANRKAQESPLGP